MANQTSIEWTDATWNPVTGCTQLSPGCDYCYALTFAERFRGVPGHHFEQGFDLRLWQSRLTLPLRWKKPRRIFVNSMSDLFHAKVPDEFVRQTFETMVKADWHTFQILTKRPQRLVRMSRDLPWPEHIWIGVSVESNDYVWRADFLRSVPAAVRFISAEPLLAPVDRLNLSGIDWVITGGESGVGHRPCDPDWVRELRDRCIRDRIAFFHKQWGGRTPKAGGRLLDGRTWDEYPEPKDRSCDDSRVTDLRDDFFEELRGWSAIKLRVLEKYLDAYMRKRGRTNPVIHYVDGFAGAGHYGDGDGAKEGSPIRAAKLAQSIADAGRPNRLVCTFTERRASHARLLEKALSSFDPSIVKALYGEFGEHLPAILRRLGSAPAIFFLDPYGVKDTTLADLKPVLHRPDTEVILNLNTRRLRMLAGFEDSHSIDARAKVDLVTRVLGESPSDRRPEWLEEWYRLGNNGNEWEIWAVNRYCARLRENSRELEYVLPYAVRESFGASPKYWIVFATRSVHGIPIMNDLVCTEDEDLFSKYRATGDATQISFLDAVYDSELNARLALLLDELHAFGLKNQGCSREALIQEFATNKFGQYRQKHYRSAVDELVKAGRASFGAGAKHSAPIYFK